MPSQNDTVGVARKILPILYIIDTSGSMAGEKIGAVNEAIAETMEVLKDVSEKNPDAELKVGVLTFSTDVLWKTNGLVFMEDFFWNDAEAGGVTNLGLALDELNHKLSRNELLVSETGFCIPVLMFMSDGEPTDEFQSALDKINAENKWFKVATKIAIAIGEEANRNVLGELVGNQEAVVAVDDVVALKKLIRVASVAISVVGSRSRVSTEGDSAAEILKQTKAQMNNDAQNTDVDFVDDSWGDSDDTVSADDGGWDEDWN